jgi:hypothetical protein
MLTSLSLAIVYAKLRSEGYPTEPAERAKLLRELNIARWPSGLSMRSKDGQRRQLQVATKSSTDAPLGNPQNFIYPHIASPHFDRQESKQEAFNTNLAPCVDSSRHINGSRLRSSLSLTTTPTEQLQEDQLFTLPEEFIAMHGFDTAAVADCRGQNYTQWEFGGVDDFPDLGIDYPDGFFKTPLLSATEICRNTSETQIEPQISYSLKSARAMADLTSENYDSHYSVPFANDGGSPYPPDTPSPFTQPTTSTSTHISRPTGTSYFGGQLLPWWRKAIPKQNRCLTPEKRNSTATNDSGYASGRNSPGNLLTESERGHPRSLTEFGGLYRVPCLRLHEPRRYNKDYMPQPTGRYKDTERCPQCQYSGIHNLCWSVKQLKREVFMTELKLDSIYNVKDLDTAGNSALHYAAVGGASFEHFVTLIHAGVNPYQLNTAGQLFLHYLRPQLKNPGCDTFDPNLVTAFNLNLVNFLNFFQLTPAFKWRDNEGMIAVDALALHISDIEIAHQIIRSVLANRSMSRVKAS